MCYWCFRPLDKQRAVENLQRLVSEAIKMAKSESHRKGKAQVLSCLIYLMMIFFLSLSVNYLPGVCFLQAHLTFTCM